MRNALPLIAILAAGACSQEPATDPAPGATERAVEQAAPADAPVAHTEPDPSVVEGRMYRYTSLENCRVLREEREEMPLTEVRCGGAGGWDLIVTDADARQVMVLDGPGERHKLDTAPIAHGAFSSFGKTAEWRGKDVSSEVGGHFEPDSLIVRFDYAENPYPAPETSDLLVVRLGRAPCVLEVVPAGPEQNGRARAIADNGRACPAN